MNLQKTAASVGRFLSKNGPTILSMLGVGGVGLTAYLSGKAALKAREICEEYITEKYTEGGSATITTFEMDKAGYLRIAKAYIPPVASAAATIFCIVGSNSINVRRIKALGGAYAVLDANFRDYKAAAVAALGTDTVNKIQEAADKAECEKQTPERDTIPDGHFIFYDRYSRRDFVSTPEDVIAAEYHLNRNFALRGYASLNEFYSFLGLPEWETGNVLGWTFDEGANYGYSWVDFINARHDEPDGTTWYSIEMIFEPTIDEYYFGDDAREVEVEFNDIHGA